MTTSDTPETDAAVISSNGQWSFVLKETCRRIERERDELQQKIEQQRKEIVRLNGATNHAGGTPLKIALRERDEARERAAKLAAQLLTEMEGVK